MLQGGGALGACQAGAFEGFDAGEGLHVFDLAR
jgi:hypothetical protein